MTSDNATPYPLCDVVVLKRVCRKSGHEFTVMSSGGAVWLRCVRCGVAMEDLDKLPKR